MRLRMLQAMSRTFRRGFAHPCRGAPVQMIKEAGAGIEPANSGFADRDLTTWLPRRVARAHNIVVAVLVSSPDRRQAFRGGKSWCPLRCFNGSTNPIIVIE